MLRDVLVGTFRRIIRLYFRDIERYGEAPGPATKGRVFVANHTNALIDPVVVLTDANCEISPVAKSTLWNIPGLRWLLDRAGAVPIVRRVDAPEKGNASNSELFDKIAAHLAQGGNILIFPEGTSHSQPGLAPLRTGAARMLEAAAARARETSGVTPTFQAVALEFDDRQDFRSRCLVLWGPVRDLGAEEGDARIAATTAQMKADLEELLVDADTHEDRLRIAHVAEMFANDAGDHTLGAWSEVGRQVELAQRTLRTTNPPVVARVAETVDAYYAELARLGAADAQVVGLATPATHDLARWQRLLLAPLAASGFALYFVPYWLPRYLARNADADATSTFKLGAALVVYPVWCAGLVAGSFVLLPPPLSFLGAAVAITSPFAALRWLDRIYEKRPALSTEDLARLARMRIIARTAIDAARETLPA